MRRKPPVTRSGRAIARRSHTRIALLTRYPRSGEVMTRIAATEGDGAALAIHDRLARHALRTVLALQACGEAAAEVRTDAAFQGAAGEWLGRGPRYRYQGEGSLGDRLAFAFASGLNGRGRRMLVIGSDCPRLEASDLREALDALATTDLVLGPAEDGGYYLIGLTTEAATRAVPALFTDIPWGGSDVLAHTIHIAENLGLAVHRLRTLPDVDVAEDLPDAEAALALRELPEGFSVGVVIPALDDAELVGAAVRSAVKGGAADVVVVDGGSGDGTRETAEAAGARVIAGPRGRAPQMNAGACEVRGDAVCFLHADTVLPDGWLPAVRAALGRPGVVAAAFDFAVPAGERHARLITAVGQTRWRLAGLPYGDQGLCVGRRTFEDLGGFPQQPTMEDYELGLRLRRLGSIERIPLPAVISARVWHDHGLVYTTALNLAVISAYRLGVSAEKLAGWRRRIARG